MVRNDATAKEVNGDVFLDVWRQAATFSTVSRRFKALTVLQRRRYEEPDEEKAIVVADEADDPEVFRKDKTTALRHRLQKLSAETREIVNLVYYQHKSI
jgi:RNA polymerase sigma-70 factor, ECF subfamily